MTNEELHTLENKLVLIVNSVQGTIECKDKQLRDSGVYDEYSKIHKQYSETSDHDLESLKRALFIQWYSITEPSCFSGISNLDEGAKLKVMKSLDALIASDKLDAELIWMLNYYMNWHFAFEKLSDFKAIHNFFLNKKEGLTKTFLNERMDKRGQMGMYWNSIADNKAV